MRYEHRFPSPNSGEMTCTCRTGRNLRKQEYVWDFVCDVNSSVCTLKSVVISPYICVNGTLLCLTSGRIPYVKSTIFVCR